ncbi:DUF3900 domain-containing protein [Paenibacillus abyssi]|uniref:DUF3898 domain-containing protein n=1 Tax=Paenibacillus abyssi TaxID=1340531 RepID=A0A917D5L1_9BACL|nr:DUF3900 domain-containing protein [Paenibacillus abyssi]GGG11527.1 hypothetical protein GCM10010916_30460 [Paenibacillus abyssi]
MSFSIQYLSFFVIQTDGDGSQSSKSFKHYQTMDHEDYAESELKSFLDSEFGRINKRKVEKNPSTEAAPTKIGRFIVEPGYELDSNPNYNLMQRLRSSDSKEEFLGFADEMVRIYMETNAVRGGAFIVAIAKPTKVLDEPLLFVMKCDFESKIARIADERSLISHVEMAISARSIKSIQYPHMPEEGMLDEWELKIHQATHARYFEDFLRFVAYEKPMPEIVSEQVIEMVHQYMDEKWQAAPDNEQGRQMEQESLEIWAASEKRDLQEKWSHDYVVEAAAQLIEHKPDLDFKFKLGGVAVKGLLSDYGQHIHFAKHNGRYVVVIEGDGFEFEKGMSPVELLHPEELEQVISRIGVPSSENDDN